MKKQCDIVLSSGTFWAMGTVCYLCDTVATIQRWVLCVSNGANVTKEWTILLYLILVNLNVKSYMWPADRIGLSRSRD